MGTVYLDRKSSFRNVGNVRTDDMREIASDCCRVARRVGGKITVYADGSGNVMVYPTGTLDEQSIWTDAENIVGVFDIPTEGRIKTRERYADLVMEALCCHVESIT